MSLTGRQLAGVVEELRALLAGGRVQKAWTRNEASFLLEVRTAGVTRLVLCGLETDASRIHLVTAKAAQSPEPTPFVGLLRKRITGSRVRSVERLGEDRVVRVELVTAAGTGTADTRHVLLAELTGRHGNVFLLDSDEVIAGSLLPNHSFRRKLVAGEPYVRPAKPPEGVRRAIDHDPLGLDALPPDGSRSACVAAFYEDRLARADATALARELLRRVRGQRTRLERRAAAIARDRGRAADAVRYRRWGELLRSAHGRVARGATSVDVPDYYADGAPDVSIPLEPSLDLGANIERYFALYRKYHDALPRIDERLDETRRRLEAVSPALDRVEVAAWRASGGAAGRPPDDPADREHDSPADSAERLRELERALEAARIIPRPRPTAERRRRETVRALPYREYVSRTGKKILVGRGGRHNDTLTLRIARGNDLWLHAHDWAGAHVVVRLERNEEIDEDSLLDAATLAAHNSKGGKRASRVEVLYTRAKHVSKSKGMPPGRVSVAKAKTILVEMEAERLRRLLEPDG